jgi:hypothetical protein
MLHYETKKFRRRAEIDGKHLLALLADLMMIDTAYGLLKTGIK